MSSNTVAADAAPMPANRRSILKAIFATGAVTIAVAPTKTRADLPDDALSALFEAHRRAKAEFEAAIDALEAAQPDPETRVVGLAGCDYSLRNSREVITNEIERHYERLRDHLGALAKFAPSAVEPAFAALEQEREAAFDRFRNAYARHDAAQSVYDEKDAAEHDALMAICAHRCGSIDELARKSAYLWALRDALAAEEFIEAILQSTMPADVLAI
jgi:hypothetical protein